jgi:hypothetical protein
MPGLVAVDDAARIGEDALVGLEVSKDALFAVLRASD